MYEDLHDGNWKKLQWYNGSFYWKHRCTRTCMMGIERSYNDTMALFTENIDVRGLAWWELKEVRMTQWLFHNTYRSTFWEARSCYRRWKRETESQKSNNLPESQCVYGRVKKLRRSNTKIAAATKTMALATELKVALSFSLVRVPVL